MGSIKSLKAIAVVATGLFQSVAGLTALRICQEIKSNVSSSSVVVIDKCMLRCYCSSTHSSTIKLIVSISGREIHGQDSPLVLLLEPGSNMCLWARISWGCLHRGTCWDNGFCVRWYNYMLIIIKTDQSYCGKRDPICPTMRWSYLQPRVL